MRTTTVSSGLITTQALTSGGSRGALRRERRAEGKIEAKRQSAAERRSADDETATVE